MLTEPVVVPAMAMPGMAPPVGLVPGAVRVVSEVPDIDTVPEARIVTPALASMEAPPLTETLPSTR